MILLSGHSLNRARKIPLEAMSLSLKERDSTAAITPADMTGIGVNSWMQDDTEPGKGMVWRVRSISTAYATNTPTVQLEHIINTLKDRVLFGEIKPGTITGNGKSTTCTAAQAVRYILKQQSDWVLGKFEYSVSNPYRFDGDTLFDALSTVSASLQDCWWTYDTTVYPFKLNIIKKPNTTDTELRAGRNLRTITKTVDRSAMYTRFYPIGANDLHISGNYIDKNTATYGVVSRIETDASLETESELRRRANERLAIHAEPTVTIDVEALELADATGVSTDRLKLGSYCRIPLPEFGTTILERITAISYQDKIGQPAVVKVTLANNLTDVTSIIAESIKSGGKSSRTSTRKDKQDLAWFEDTNDHVSMCAIGIIGTDAKGQPNWKRLSEITVDGTGIHQTVKSVQGDLVIAQTAIQANENSIKLEAERATKAEGKLQGKITINADNITAEVSRAQNKETQLEGKLIVQADKAALTVKTTDNRHILYFPNRNRFPATGSTTYLYLDVATGKYYEWKDGQYKTTTPGQTIKAGEICVAINESNEVEARLDADKVYIGNSKSTTVINGKCKLSDVSATYIKGQIAAIDNVGMISANVTGTLSAGSLYGGTIKFRTSAGSGYTYTDLKDLFVTSLNISLANNVYTLTANNANATAVSTVTFSRAVTDIGYQWGSNNGKLTVTAYPQNYSKQIIGITTSGSWSGSTYNGKVKYYEGNDDEHTYDTGVTFTLTAPSPGSAIDNVNCTTPYGAEDGKGHENTSGSGNQAYYRSGSTWGTVVKCEIRDENNNVLATKYNYLEGAPTAIANAAGGGGASYTKYTFSRTRTQSTDGYHYTFTISTGWQTPFGNSGGTYDLYKKN